jgi:DnaJ-class molecular chaperone
MSNLYDCPRCGGTGEYTMDMCGKRCRACGATGKVTPEEWQEWCDVAHGGENRMQFPSPPRKPMPV